MNNYKHLQNRLLQMFLIQSRKKRRVGIILKRRILTICLYLRPILTSQRILATSQNMTFTNKKISIWTKAKNSKRRICPIVLRKALRKRDPGKEIVNAKYLHRILLKLTIKETNNLEVALVKSQIKIISEGKKS